MHWLRRNPFFYTALSVLVLAVLLGMWRVSELKTRLAELKGEYARKSAQYASYLELDPAPTSANLEALEENYRTLYQAYTRTQANLNLNTFDPKLFFGDVPETSTDAFFQIARYVEDLRTLAADNQVAYPADKRFGFGAYTNVGPDRQHIETVHRQVKVLSLVMQSLLESGISELVNVQRQPVQSSSNPAAAGSPLDGDLVAGPVGAEIERKHFREVSFRLAFKGQSSSLRNFLNRIAASTLPLTVKGVEVEQMRSGESRARPERRSAPRDNPFFDPELDASLIRAAQVPIISENESLFVVSFCFLEQTSPIEEPAAQPDPESVADAPSQRGDNA